MKTFTVLQAGNVFRVEADIIRYHFDGALTILVKEDNPVFGGPSAFTTVIQDDVVKSRPDSWPEYKETANGNIARKS